MFSWFTGGSSKKQEPPKTENKEIEDEAKEEQEEYLKEEELKEKLEELKTKDPRSYKLISGQLKKNEQNKAMNRLVDFVYDPPTDHIGLTAAMVNKAINDDDLWRVRFRMWECGTLGGVPSFALASYLTRNIPFKKTQTCLVMGATILGAYLPANAYYRAHREEIQEFDENWYQLLAERYFFEEKDNILLDNQTTQEKKME